ncbi:hypothetical protein, partial [Neolewinella agarilytica]|uniref:hypothetical protein n=1 Tax=Neolewinella agarilytica TaxID=478744 RepID=UPI0023577190
MTGFAIAYFNSFSAPAFSAQMQEGAKYRGLAPPFAFYDLFIISAYENFYDTFYLLLVVYYWS